MNFNIFLSSSNKLKKIKHKDLLELPSSAAIYLETKKDYNAALENFKNCVLLNPTSAQTYFARGYTYSKLKEKESAKADYNMALKIQANFEPAIQALNEL